MKEGKEHESVQIAACVCELFAGCLLAGCWDNAAAALNSNVLIRE